MLPDISKIGSGNIARQHNAFARLKACLTPQSVGNDNMNMKPHLIYCATAVFLGLLFAYLFRYSITGTGETRAYKLDRWSGEVVGFYGTRQALMKPPNLSAPEFE